MGGTIYNGLSADRVQSGGDRRPRWTPTEIAAPRAAAPDLTDISLDDSSAEESGALLEAIAALHAVDPDWSW